MEIKTPTQEEYENKRGGNIPDFCFKRETLQKFSDINIPLQLADIVRELINNCHKHGNKFDPNKKVFITVEETNDGLTVTIEDEGAGYPPNIINDLHIPFSKKPTQKKPDGRGSGFYAIRKGLENNKIYSVEIIDNKIKLTIKK